MTEEGKQNKAVLVYQKLEHYHMFLLHLFLYLDLKEALNEVKENNEYSCDGSLVPNENPCQFKFLVHCDLA